METNSVSGKKRPFWKLNRKEQRIALVVLAALLIGVSLPSRIIVSTSDSLDHRVFFKVPVDPATIELGDHPLYRLQGEE